MNEPVYVYYFGNILRDEFYRHLSITLKST